METLALFHVKEKLMPLEEVATVPSTSRSMVMELALNEMAPCTRTLPETP